MYLKYAATQPFKETDYTIIACDQTNNLEKKPCVYLNTMKNTQKHYSIQAMYSTAQFKPNIQKKGNGVWK